MKIGLLFAACIWGIAVACTASAETVTGDCLVTEVSTATLTVALDRIVQHADTAPRARPLSLNFDTHIMHLGDANAHFADDDTKITAMTRLGAAAFSWQIDRRTGRLSGASFFHMNGNDVFTIVSGLCTRSDSARF